MGNSPAGYKAWRKQARNEIHGDYDAEIEEEIRDHTYQLYIGADNETGVVDTDRLYELLNRRHKGWTITFGFGYWEGQKESSVIVTIVCPRFTMLTTVSHIKLKLKQDAVGVVELPKMTFQ